MRTVTLADSDAAIRQAADVIKAGGLVAIPTETVYGLGADALNPAAVKKIYVAKGRPADNPLIIHIADMDGLNEVAFDIPPLAYALADKLWPGPLTLILKKHSRVPSETTGGLATAAVRLPRNETARRLIRAAGTPIAAPSSNVSGRPSATTAKHVFDDLGGRIDMILDGGACEIGLESTVCDLLSSPPRVLRPGAVTLTMLRDVEPSFVQAGPGEGAMSPGMRYTHYAPKAEVMLVTGGNTVRKILDLIAEYAQAGKRIGVMASDETAALYEGCGATVISAGSRERLETIAANLYETLREFDRRGVDVIFAEGYAPEGLGFTITDRLARAAGGRVIES